MSRALARPQRSPMLMLGAAVGAFLLVAPFVVPLVLGDFWLTVLTEIFIWGLFAASVNLLFGYTGLLSFGQALYFGMGAYGVAFGVDWFGLPFWPSFALGIVFAVATAAVAGIFAARLTWHYFAIITIVFSLIFYFLAVGWKDLTNGDDGMPFTVPPVLELGDFELTMLNLTHQYYFVLAVVGACYVLLWRVLESPLGRAFVAVRENDTRASLIGFSPYKIRFLSFLLAGLLAGVAGALFALFARYATAQYLFWTVSGEGVIWTIVGGAGTLFGPAIGAALLIVLREELSVYWEHYLMIVGVVVILVVTFAPSGIMGLLRKHLPESFAERRSARASAALESTEGARRE